MRIAAAGLGGAWTRGHLPAVVRLESERKVTLVGGADPDVQRRAILADRLPHVPGFASVDDMLASVDCDALVVATDPSAHAELIALAFRQGLHVICEKPLTVGWAQHELVARACAERVDLALVPVHQYRYSPQWMSIARWARCASVARIPFSLIVDLEREGTDSNAVSEWRADSSAAGGMLADAGVHFLALAWTIDRQLEVLGSARNSTSESRERAAAIVRLGHGVLAIQAWNGASIRRTRVELRTRSGSITWCDGSASVSVRGRSLRRRQVAALSDRTHVDALYVPFYRDVVRNIGNGSWRMHRTAEALGVGRALVTLLERAPLESGLVA
ncbi:MAG TPA: Gfo/Idh/MocA family oxidoreductase [Solirubrobacteraceae bacterium]|jgi:predicted dehydrogenase|nr:Gfo/Idh/MocA family oxidoreductase [Solirubrobacteraceae bacterium]